MIKKRVFSISCKSKELCQELMEKLWEEGGFSRSVVMSVKGDKLIITIYGLDHEIIETWNRIRGIASLYIKAHTMRHGITDISYEELTKIAKKPFIPEALVAVLEIMGYSSKYVNNRLLTTAPLSVVVDIVRRIGEALELIGRWRISPSAKKLLTAAYALGIDFEEVKALGSELGLLKVEEFKLELLRDWKETLLEIVKAHKSLEERR